MLVTGNLHQFVTQRHVALLKLRDVLKTQPYIYVAAKRTRDSSGGPHELELSSDNRDSPETTTRSNAMKTAYFEGQK